MLHSRVADEEVEETYEILNTWPKYVEELYETRNRLTILDIENEIDISEDEKDFQFL